MSLYFLNIFNAFIFVIKSENRTQIEQGGTQLHCQLISTQTLEKLPLKDGYLRGRINHLGTS